MVKETSSPHPVTFKKLLFSRKNCVGFGFTKDIDLGFTTKIENLVQKNRIVSELFHTFRR